jgi:hypothetical protein
MFPKLHLKLSQLKIFSERPNILYIILFLFLFIFFFINLIINQQSTISNYAELCGLYIGCAELCEIVRTVQTVRNFSKIFCADLHTLLQNLCVEFY